VKHVSRLHNMILLSWKQQSAFDYFSKTNTETGFAKSSTTLIMTELLGGTWHVIVKRSMMLVRCYFAFFRWP